MSELQKTDKIIGENLRTIRQMKGMSQQEVGDILGVTFQQIQKYERGINRFHASSVFYLSKQLKVKVTDFYARTSEMVEASQFDNETLSHAKAFNEIKRADLRKKIHSLTLAVGRANS